MPQGEVKDERHTDIVVILDMNPYAPIIDTMAEKLRGFAMQASFALEGKYGAEVGVIDIVAKTKETPSTCSCFEVVLEVSDFTVEEAIEAADKVAESICTACKNAAIHVAAGFAEVRVPTTYYFGKFPSEG